MWVHATPQGTVRRRNALEECIVAQPPAQPEPTCGQLYVTSPARPPIHTTMTDEAVPEGNAYTRKQYKSDDTNGQL